MDRIKFPDADHVLELAEEHVLRYKGMLSRARAGATGFRENELVKLLDIWRSIEAKEGQQDILTEDETNEVRDAYYDELED